MKTGNRGQVLVVFIAALLGLLGIAALGIDMGYLYTSVSLFRPRACFRIHA